VIPAGGRGTRLGGSIPKQFLLLDGKPILLHSIEKFESLEDVGEIIVVVPVDQIRRTERLIADAGFRKVSHVVVGGNERQHSVRNGLLSFENDPDIVLVHDAVRPLVSQEVIREVIKQSKKHGAAVVGVRVIDTIKVEGAGFYTKTLDRKNLWAVQTPQGFSFELLMKAHAAAQHSSFLGTDEASLVERLRIPVKIVAGDYKNMKVTTQSDLRIAKMLSK
jgi:2-C-methyl-D-erythritol 4-phosphate cytidylyltransferase